ncbi:MAG: GNAT family protein [Actinomycetes bacterium]
MADTSLRPMEPEDVPAVAGILADPSLAGRRGFDISRPVPRSVDSIVRWLNRALEEEDGAMWAVESGGVVGLARASWGWDAASPWVHVVIDPRHQRHGHATRAFHLMLDHLFLYTPAHIVQAGVPGWDEEGLAFMAHLSGREVGRMRRVGIREGAYFDEVDFVFTRDDCEVRRGAGG